MIYINNTTESQSIAIPLYSQPNGNDYDLAVKRTTTAGGEYLNIPITFIKKDRLYVYFSVALPSGMTDGEYEYRLREDECIISGGIIQITGVVYADIQHEQNITYQEYESR